MKKILISILALLMLTACGGAKEENVVNVYNWGEYIDKTVLDDFEKETGIKVKYDNFVTNEDLYVKMKKGGDAYDVVVPSEYMIEKMAKEDMLEKLDTSKLTNIKNIDPKVQAMLDQAGAGYSVPYFWGTLGIVYNKTMVTDKVDSWNILWDKKYENKLIMLDSSRDSIGVALLKNGYSLNSSDEKELEIAKKDLIAQKPLVMAYQVDEAKGYMVGGEAAMAVMYSGDAFDAVRENPDLAYAIPKEGSNIWVDGMVIPKNAKNMENAYKFIDFILKPEIAAKIGNEIGYSTPNQKAIELLEDDLKNSEISFPNLDNYKLEIFRDPGKMVEVYDTIWTDIISN